jgi:hypothetical protein
VGNFVDGRDAKEEVTVFFDIFDIKTRAGVISADPS